MANVWEAIFSRHGRFQTSWGSVSLSLAQSLPRGGQGGSRRWPQAGLHPNCTLLHPIAPLVRSWPTCGRPFSAVAGGFKLPGGLSLSLSLCLCLAAAKEAAGDGPRQGCTPIAPFCTLLHPLQVAGNVWGAWLPLGESGCVSCAPSASRRPRRQQEMDPGKVAPQLHPIAPLCTLVRSWPTCGGLGKPFQSSWGLAVRLALSRSAAARDCTPIAPHCTPLHPS